MVHDLIISRISRGCGSSQTWKGSRTSLALLFKIVPRENEKVIRGEIMLSLVKVSTDLKVLHPIWDTIQAQRAVTIVGFWKCLWKKRTQSNISLNWHKTPAWKLNWYWANILYYNCTKMPARYLKNVLAIHKSKSVERWLKVINRLKKKRARVIKATETLSPLKYFHFIISLSQYAHCDWSI